MTLCRLLKGWWCASCERNMSETQVTAKELIIVGGPNGAGKTTIGLEYASLHSTLFLSADAIAAEMSPDDPAAQRMAAGTQFIRKLDSALKGDTSLVVESTLSGRTLRHKLRDARERGFTVTIVFMFLDSAETCVQRVKERVRKGGHDVAEQDVRRRFGRSITNFWKIYRQLANHWLLIYNSGNQPVDVAVGTASDTAILDLERFELFQSFIGTDSHG